MGIVLNTSGVVQVFLVKTGGKEKIFWKKSVSNAFEKIGYIYKYR